MDNKIAIIADDFTGSNDTGVQFSKRNLKTVVVFNLYNIDNLDKSVDVIVIDTESRADSKNDAYDKNFKAAEKLKSRGVKYIYKKLDSTLRGNIGSEIEGVMDGGEFDLAVVCPALPENGRKTIGGNQFIYDIPLEKTEIAKDPIAPVKHSFIEDIIKEQCDKKSVTINIKDLLKGEEHYFKVVRDLIKNDNKIIISDSITREDLNLVSKIIKKIDKRVLLVGSAGLAESLPEVLNLKNQKVINNYTREGIIAGIVGSVSDVSRKQVEFANKQLNNLKVIDINLEKVLDESQNEEKIRLKKLIKKNINSNKDIIIRSAKERKLVEKAREIGKNKGLNNKEVSKKIAEFMGNIAKELYQEKEIKALFLTGGDIAIQSASIIGAEANIIKEEVLPGIPLSFLSGNELKEKPVVTKAGAFGEDDSVVKIFQYLREWEK